MTRTKNLPANRFLGPVFIVGMPRSGTKLLRDLLNQHPNVSIPVAESHFIPYMMARFGDPPRFDEPGRFAQFYEEFRRTPFFWTLHRQGRVLPKGLLSTSADLNSWASIFEMILKYYAPECKGEWLIWGDKTPGYVRHLGLLKALYGEAKFLHIIRDPRDYALSVKKAWGKSVIRAANTWRLTLEEGLAESQQFCDDYLEIYYEDLITEPHRTLMKVCSYLDIEFLPSMMQLNKPTENLGDAKGETRIVSDNYQKYRTKMTQATIKRIEEVVYPALGDTTPYLAEFATKFRPVSPLDLRLLWLYDGLNSALFHIREKGLREGISYFYRHHERSSWR